MKRAIVGLLVCASVSTVTATVPRPVLETRPRIVLAHWASLSAPAPYHAAASRLSAAEALKAIAGRLEAEEIRQALARLRTIPTPGTPVYWVDDNGAAANWGDCLSATPISGASACTMTKANQNADAGQTVYLRAGTYNTPIEPTHDGTLANRITFTPYNGEIVRITSVGTNQAGIELDGVDYIVVTGASLTVDNTDTLMNIQNGSNRNEISYLTLHTGTATTNNGVNIRTLPTVVDATKNTHNWLHHLTIYGGGVVDTVPSPPPPATPTGCGDDGGLITVGADGNGDGLSDFNTIEDSLIYWGSHHAFKLNTHNNVVRRNFIHNEGSFPASAACEAVLCSIGGLYGNRGLASQSTHNGQPAWVGNTFNLLEQNRVGSAGLAGDGNGSDGITIGGEKDIVRFNVAYANNEVGIYFRSSGEPGDSNSVYNNTVFSNGLAPVCRSAGGVQRRGIRVQNSADNNYLINNITYSNPTDILIGATAVGTVCTQNWTTTSATGTGCTSAGTNFGDPLFSSTSISDPTSASTPDFTLLSGSGAINNGVSLTLANGAGVATVTLIVDRALFFQYGERGSDLSDIQPDVIAIGTVSNTFTISSIDYDTNTITLTAPATWSDNAQIWLKSDSSGNDRLKGVAPDQGAFEKQ